MLTPSWIFMLLIALTKMGAAFPAASSAARFMESIALSTTPPKPKLRSVLSTFWASGGISTLIIALPKNPLAVFRRLPAFFAPISSACRRAATISVLDRLLRDVPLPEPGFVLVLCLLITPFKASRQPWALLSVAESKKRPRTVTVSTFFIKNWNRARKPGQGIYQE